VTSSRISGRSPFSTERAVVDSASSPSSTRLTTASDQHRSGFVEQPMGFRLPGAERSRGVEAIENTVAVEEQQPILRPAPGREEEQLQRVGRQHAVPVQ
jgi:hypothetical protein